MFFLLDAQEQYLWIIWQFYLLSDFIYVIISKVVCEPMNLKLTGKQAPEVPLPTVTSKLFSNMPVTAGDLTIFVSKTFPSYLT
jgi:hypothetical protein